MKQQLARLLDPEALDAATGPRARLRVRVDAAWLVEGAELEITAPKRLECARCGGGGCDGCGRSGALRAPVRTRARAIRLHVPAGEGHAVGLRLVHPFGARAAIEQLLLELEPSTEPDARVKRIDSAAEGSEGTLVWSPIALVATALVALGVVVAMVVAAR